MKAALKAANKAPGLTRDNFGFQHIKGFTRDHYNALCDSLKQDIQETLPNKIIVSDRDAHAVKAAEKNARNAGVDHLLQFQVCDFAETPIPPGKGCIVFQSRLRHAFAAAKSAQIPVQTHRRFYETKLRRI
ncbi:MAG: hypothetical protein U5R06_13145 [candidate division KSB1 bacterium]|nr:hypothetical protein [candidate division KSB1 bacterium]